MFLPTRRSHRNALALASKRHGANPPLITCGQAHCLRLTVQYASLPAGIDTTWHVTTPFKEFWVLS